VQEQEQSADTVRRAIVLGAALIKKIKKNCPKLKFEVGNL
jgi:hypothetical protein